MVALTVTCHGVVEPQHDEEHHKTRWRCPKCGLDLQVRDELQEELFAPAAKVGMIEVPLPILITALGRTRR